MRRVLVILLVVIASGALFWGVSKRFARLEQADPVARGLRAAVPVEVGPVEHGTIALLRTFSGAVEAAAEFVVAPKVAGRLERLEVDLGDGVVRGQVVAHLDDDELVQAVHLSEADLAVATASRAEARSALEIAERGLRRARTLREERVTSESQLDAALALELARRAHVEVAVANVTRAEAALETARIRLGYARLTADWNGGDDHRVVSERFVDEGETVSANAAIMSIVELAPVVGVVHVPERDYAYLSVGQLATLTTDAYPGRTFEGRVSRISPVFRRATRQARVELLVANEDEHLRPGMFVRATIEFERIEDALSVPYEALTVRDGRTGVFVVDAAGERVRWSPVEVGVREGTRVQVHADGLSGRVVTLGQELCDDGSLVLLPRVAETSTAERATDSTRGAE